MFMVRDEYGDIRDVLTGMMEHYGMSPEEAFESWLFDGYEGHYELVEVTVRVVSESS